VHHLTVDQDGRTVRTLAGSYTTEYPGVRLLPRTLVEGERYVFQIESTVSPHPATAPARTAPHWGWANLVSALQLACDPSAHTTPDDCGCPALECAAGETCDGGVCNCGGGSCGPQEVCDSGVCTCKR
jgi:hypothetical protein